MTDYFFTLVQREEPLRILSRYHRFISFALYVIGTDAEAARAHTHTHFHRAAGKDAAKLTLNRQRPRLFPSESCDLVRVHIRAVFIFSSGGSALTHYAHSSSCASCPAASVGNSELRELQAGAKQDLQRKETPGWLSSGDQFEVGPF